MNRANLPGDLKRAVAPHEFQRRQILSSSFFRQTRNRVFKDPSVIFIDAESCAGFLSGFNKLPDAQASVAIDAPGQLHPEFIFFPDLAGIHFAGIVHLVTITLSRGAHHRLAKTEPLRVMGLVRMNVVTLRPQAHRQNVISEVRSFIPHRCERHVTTDQIFVSQCFDPGEAVGIRPHRVVNARKVSIEFAASVFQKMRQKKRHLVHR